MSVEDSAATDQSLGAIVSWWEANRRELPWRSSRDVYAIWVSEVMAAQTAVARAASAWERWMQRWPTVQSLAGASLAEVLVLWQGLGYPRRARDLHRGAQIVGAHGWPADLRSLPGVGEYTAAAIRCFALEEPVLPRDVNVNRVLARRFGGVVEIAEDHWRISQALMEFGQRICRAIPDCPACPVRHGCPGAEQPGAAQALAPVTRQQRPYEGSLRQRRGRLLTQVLCAGSIPAPSADAEAAESLLRDGLLRGDGHSLRVPD